ncbi:MAG: CDP-alcohol phosphatidyltransferase family protein [Sulfurimonas sp.]|jgi:CDP-diacylglycerol---glycerol-3-phosphate 3-phosphatidyltransferase
MSIYDLKPKFQQLLRPIIENLHKKGVTPNQVTLWAIYLSILGGAFVYLSSISKYFLFLIPIVLFVRMALNAIDGVLARDFDQMSDKGAILNELGDVVSDTILYLPFIVILDKNLVIIFVVLAILSEFAGILAWAVYGTRRYNGPLGKSDRAFLIGLISLLIAVYDLINISNFLLAVAIVLLIPTIYNRSKA